MPDLKQKKTANVLTEERRLILKHFTMNSEPFVNKWKDSPTFT